MSLDKYLALKKTHTLQGIQEYMRSDIEIDEKDVLYLMTSFRILIEQDYYNLRNSDFRTLWFLANWCLHNHKNREDYQDILDAPENEFIESNKVRTGKGQPALDESERKGFYLRYIVTDIMGLTKLREQIISIMNDNGIITDLIKDTKRDGLWAKFKRKLVERLVLTPYSIKDSSSFLEMLIIEKSSDMKEANPNTYIREITVFFKNGEHGQIAYLDGSES